MDGNIDLRGAQLSRPGGDALEASGVRIGGNLRCDRGLSSQGRLVLAGASVAGNAVFSGAALQGTTTPDDPAVLVLPRGSADPSAALLADRLRVNGNLSIYQTAPLHRTLAELADLNRLNYGAIRVIVGAIDVETALIRYFDNAEHNLTFDAVMASGSLPPGFPMTEIDGQ